MGDIEGCNNGSNGNNDSNGSNDIVQNSARTNFLHSEQNDKGSHTLKKNFRFVSEYNVGLFQCTA